MGELSNLAVTARARQTSTVHTCIALATAEENHKSQMSGTGGKLGTAA